MKTIVFTLVSAHPRTGSWWTFHSQISKKTTQEPILQFGSPKYEKVTKVTPKWTPRGSQNPSKIYKNPGLDPKVSGLGVPGDHRITKMLSQCTKMHPQVVKMEPPGLPNHWFASPASHQLTGYERGRRQGRSLKILNNA